LKALPIRLKFLSVQLGPRFHKASLTSRQRTSNQLDRLQTENGNFVSEASVKVRQRGQLA
jgi:hypothetical protein